MFQKQWKYERKEVATVLKYYKFKYYLNASHSFHNDRENAHAHTFAITLFIEIMEKGFISFYEVDKKLEQYFAAYNGQYLNETAAFSDIEPTCENMGDFFYEDIRERLMKYRMHLRQLEIAETPVRKYCISDKLLMSSTGTSDIDDRWKNIMEAKKELLATQIKSKEGFR